MKTVRLVKYYDGDVVVDESDWEISRVVFNGGDACRIAIDDTFTLAVIMTRKEFYGLHSCVTNKPEKVTIEYQSVPWKSSHVCV